MTCYLCGSSELDVLREKLRHDVQRRVLVCRSCGLDQLEPRPDDLREYYAGDYRRQYSPVIDTALDSQAIFDMYSPMQGPRLEVLRPYLRSDGAVLDVGASAGHFLHAVAPFVKECVAIEFNAENLEFLRERLGFSAHGTRVEETDLPTGHFDLITCIHTLEHMDDPRAFLCSVRDYLTPSGVLFIEVPNVDDALLSLYDIPSYADFWYRDPHLFNFSPSTLRLLLEQAGFTGELIPVQSYGFLNHLHWLNTGKPQPSASVAMAPARLVDGHEGAAADELNQWMIDIDRQYREILVRHEITESIGFLARRIDA